MFREYIDAQSTNVQFSDVLINAFLSFHFILSFAIDYTPMPTNGVFTPFRDTGNLSPAAVAQVLPTSSTTSATSSAAMAPTPMWTSSTAMVPMQHRRGPVGEVLRRAGARNYPGAKVLASFKTSDVTGLISPNLGVRVANKELQWQNKLSGLFSVIIDG
jgi:hypothetical protein